MIEIGNLDEFKDLLKKFEKKSEKELDVLLADSALKVQSMTIKRINSGGRGGREYKRGGIRHRASKAGEFPKTDRGNLVQNIIAEKRGRLDWFSGSNKKAPYGLWLEFGTRNIDKRPWLKPVFNIVIKMIKRKYG